MITCSKTEKNTLTGHDAVSHASPSSILQLWGAGRGRSMPLGPLNRGMRRTLSFYSSFTGNTEQQVDPDQEFANSDEENVNSQLQNPCDDEETPQGNSGNPRNGDDGSDGDDGSGDDDNGGDDDMTKTTMTVTTTPLTLAIPVTPNP